MDSREVIAQKKEILLHLSKRQLKEAFEGLKLLVERLQSSKHVDSLNALEANYKLMLHYLFEGMEDPQRDEVYRNLLRSLYEVADDLSDELLLANSSNIFYEKLRYNNYSFAIKTYHSDLKDVIDSISLVDLLEEGEEKTRKKRELAVRRERIDAGMFNAIFISHRSTEDDLIGYTTFIDSIEVATRDKSLLISALTLSLFHRFDYRKIQALMHTAALDNMQLRARAMVGLIVVMQMYDVRWGLYPELQNQLAVLSENIDFRKAVLRIIIQLIRSRETEEISKKITEEILPEMMKFNSLAGRKLNMEDLMGETDFAEKNPEWQKELEESGLSKKLQEYSHLQMEGADVFHSTFAGLKNFPFFSDMGNWFLPFDIAYSELMSLFPNEPQNNILKTAILDSGHMCNSDKYSFCLSLLQISSAQREMMMGRMGAESEQIKELQKDTKALNPHIDEEIISNQYIQDLYRFFKLNPYRNSFFDIFKLSLNFYDKISISPLIDDIESMKKIAFYCFDKNNFKEALGIFERILKVDRDSDDIWQKTGYCKQMLNDQQGALQAYLQADYLKPNNSWIIRRIAQLYRSLKETELSLEFYKKAAKLTPDNVHIELNIGHCYLELGDHEQALNTYFKVEFLDTKGSKAMRPIAWTAFLLRKYDLAKKYYERILKSEPTIHDYLNAGHVALCSGDKKDAVKYYRMALDKESDLELFLMLFDADESNLIEHGVDKKLFPFLFDQIQYK